MKLTLIIGAVSLAIALIAALVLTIENAGSRTLILGFAALVGTSAIFGIQVWLELQPSTDRDLVSVEYTIDHQLPAVGRLGYGNEIQAVSEVDASKWLAANDPQAFTGDNNKLVSDFAIFSLLSFLANAERNWQVTRVRPRGQSVNLLPPKDEDDGAAAFTSDDLRSRLSGARNLFAGAKTLPNGSELRLPPGSTVSVSPTSVVIENPVCRIEWLIGATGVSVSYFDPRTREASQRFETHETSFVATVKYSRWHSQRRDRKKYVAWIDRLLVDAHDWFERTGSFALTGGVGDNSTPNPSP